MQANRAIARAQAAGLGDRAEAKSSGGGRSVGGEVRHQVLKISEDADPGSYIIVTLLVGTEHDKPLFDNVQTNEGLKIALQNLGAVSTTDLLILELLWNP